MNVFDVEAINAQIEANQKEIDEFAIGFAEWLIYMYKEGILYYSHSNKELLEIYKKEKGL
jgi:hypothetical protein